MKYRKHWKALILKTERTKIREKTDLRNKLISFRKMKSLRWRLILSFWNVKLIIPAVVYLSDIAVLPLLATEPLACWERREAKGWFPAWASGTSNSWGKGTWCHEERWVCHQPTVCSPPPHRASAEWRACCGSRHKYWKWPPLINLTFFLRLIFTFFAISSGSS